MSIELQTTDELDLLTLRDAAPTQQPQPTVVAHLLASPFYGGPERQMLGMASALPETYRTHFITFAERGLALPFADEARRRGFGTTVLQHNAPNYLRAIEEITNELRRIRADILLCHGYKSDLAGWRAARRARIPVVAVSRGWTGATWKVKLNETLDRLSLFAMDRTVCVSEGQAASVRRGLLPSRRIDVVHNSIAAERFAAPDPRYRARLEAFFPERPDYIVGAAGRLSPEKGFDVLIAAAERVVRQNPRIGFVIFGEGPLREKLEAAIARRGLSRSIVLPGFCSDLDQYIPQLDLLAISSYREGLPNVMLEAFAAGVPVVGTAVFGIPEVIQDGVNGYLVRAGDSESLARRIGDVLGSDQRRVQMGQAGKRRVLEEFTFAAQARGYQKVIDGLIARTQAGTREDRS